jgi:hypothetical protein
MKTIEQSINKGQQSLDYKELLNFNGVKLKISIKSDSYKQQCFAKIEVWNDFKWNLIDSIHYNEMNTDSKLVYNFSSESPNKSDNHLFKADRNKLLDIAKSILS